MIPTKYSEWREKPFKKDADSIYAVSQAGKEVDPDLLPTGYVYLEDYDDQGYIYIVDYDEASTLNVFVYAPPLQQLRSAFNSGTQGKPGSIGLMLTPPNEVYDFFNTYIDGVGVKPAENYNEHTELKIYYADGVAHDGYKLGMFHVAQDISRQVDFVTANVHKSRRIFEKEEEATYTDENGVERESHTYTLEPVPVNLQHQLCNIEIKARNANPNYDIDVAGVMIGRPMVYGPMFNFSTNDWEFPPLTRQDLYEIVTYAYSPASAKHTTGDYIHRLGETSVSLMGNGGNAFVLPTKLDAWTYQHPDNQDAYNFNEGNRPIMFLGALIQVTTKGGGSGPVDIAYPVGSVRSDYDENSESNDWEYDNSNDVWVSPVMGYYGDDCFWYYDSDVNDDDYDGVWSTEDDDNGSSTGFSFDVTEGTWSYDKTNDSGNYYEKYAWLLNWKIGEDGYWYYKGTDWVYDEDGNWKYIKGDAKFKYDETTGTGQWTRGSESELIFPTDYVCEKGNFDFQEFCVVKNGFTHDYDNPGLGEEFKPDYVLDNSKYNDRDLGSFSDQEKTDFLADLRGKIEANKETGYHPNEDPDLVINSAKNVEFRKYAWVGFPVDVDWQKGHKYVYTLDFTDGLGVETPNGIYGGRLISDIIKIFAEQEKGTGRANSDADPAARSRSAKSPDSPSKQSLITLPSGMGAVTMESSGEWTGGVIVK